MEKFFTSRLKKWHAENPRPMPWSGLKDPYLIWISEIILQQTRVNQGWDYYLRFTKRFPNVQTLAKASQDEVLKMWEGLGYYSRARNLHIAANQIVNDHGGKFPESYDEIISLKGIGPYTAAAISSFAFDLPHPVLDGNVLRVMTRFLEIDEDILQQKTKNKILKKLERYINTYNIPSEFNQALMNFGAMQCTPGSPNCSICPLRSKCKAFGSDRVEVLPVKKKKLKKKKRFFHYLHIHSPEGTLIKKRSGKDIWKGLYEFPLIELESATELKLGEITEHLQDLGVSKKQKIEQLDIFEQKHELTHQTIFAKVYPIKTRKLRQEDDTYILVNSLNEYAFPRLLNIYLQYNLLKND